MMKRINVSGDIESRRRISVRHTVSAVPQTIIPKLNENSQEKEHKDGQTAASTKARKRKAEGNP
ncbi:hypothetical protein [uncultured Duncaniella sp.]|uniref:hypothetical protein n=1 Tax=uncultured Duncaniella sp. TaxID=2768039 RepID=UPI0025A93FE2|nr:hypothetical protein [uncultured Duncaniella sp.]